MSTGDSFETRFEKIDNLLRDPKSEVNSDCLLVSSTVLFCLSEVLYLFPSSCFQSGYLQKKVSGVHHLGKHQNLVFFLKSLGVPLKAHAVDLFIIGLALHSELLALTQFIVTQKILINLCCRRLYKKLPRQSHYYIYSLLNGDLSNINPSYRFDSKVGKDCFHLQLFISLRV